MQEYKERTERIKALREEFTTASTDLQTLTTAVEEKKVSYIPCLRLMEESKFSTIQQMSSAGNMDSCRFVPHVFWNIMQDSWLPEVKRMVGIVDEHFRRMLRNMGCNGQISLYCGCPDFDGCNAFDKYAIHIRVKFRDEEALQLLTANRQSGGERAVCTILYIIALQVVLCFACHPCFGPTSKPHNAECALWRTPQVAAQPLALFSLLCGKHADCTVIALQASPKQQFCHCIASATLQVHLA